MSSASNDKAVYTFHPHVLHQQRSDPLRKHTLLCWQDAMDQEIMTVQEKFHAAQRVLMLNSIAMNSSCASASFDYVLRYKAWHVPRRPCHSVDIDVQGILEQTAGTEAVINQIFAKSMCQLRK
jgi:hypothetical protein